MVSRASLFSSLLDQSPGGLRLLWLKKRELVRRRCEPTEKKVSDSADIVKIRTFVEFKINITRQR